LTYSLHSDIMVTMNERKQRTPDEIIADTQAKLSRLLVTQAKKDAKTDPLVQPLIAELDAVKADIREAKKGLGSGPQSFEARITKHEIWIQKIRQEKADALVTLDYSDSRKDQLEREIHLQVRAAVQGKQEKTAQA